MATKAKKFINQIINEGSTSEYAVVLKRPDGTVIADTSIDALTLTLCTLVGGTEINGRTDQDVLNTNNVTVDSLGQLTYIGQPLDNIIVDTTATFETHLATFKMTYDTASKGNWDIEFKIRNLTKVT